MDRRVRMAGRHNPRPPDLTARHLAAAARQLPQTTGTLGVTTFRRERGSRRWVQNRATPTQSRLGLCPTEGPTGEVHSFIVGERIVAKAVTLDAASLLWRPSEGRDRTRLPRRWTIALDRARCVRSPRAARRSPSVRSSPGQSPSSRQVEAIVGAALYGRIACDHVQLLDQKRGCGRLVSKSPGVMSVSIGGFWKRLLCSSVISLDDRPLRTT